MKSRDVLPKNVPGGGVGWDGLYRGGWGMYGWGWGCVGVCHTGGAAGHIGVG